MSVFRRKGRGGDSEPGPEVADDRGDGGAPATPPGPATTGPWDVADFPGAREELIDLGALALSGVPPAVTLQLEQDPATQQVIAVVALLDGGAVRLQPYAAPRSGGLWEEVRGDLAAAITRDGGVVDVAEGRFGPELRAQVQAATANGGRGMAPMRFVGVDGPRWFLRAVFTGAAADPAAAQGLEDLVAGCVVDRGAEAMAPQDPLPLRMPPVAPPGPAGDAPGDGGSTGGTPDLP